MFADRFGELPAVFALDPVEQTDEIPPGPLAHFNAPETMSNARHEVIQRFRPSADRGEFEHLCIACLHDPPPFLLSGEA